MSLDHEAIRKAYPSVKTIDDTGSKILDASGNSVTVEQSKIDAARATIDSDYAKVKYKDDRLAAYPSIQDQLDMQYWDKKNGTTTWVDAIAKVKSDNPKP